MTDDKATNGTHDAKSTTTEDRPKITTDDAQRFAKLFEGLDRAYGKYVLDENIIATDGQKAKGRGITVSEDLLAERYEDHLNGGEMLGVVPIMDGNLCRFAAIDIDDYKLDIPGVLARVKALGLDSLVPTRSKSGGLHLWMFFVDAIPARAVMKKMEEIAAALGFPGVEVFPKQYKIGPDDVGNWINLPWYDAGVDGGGDRYGWNLDGGSIRDLGEWLEYAEGKRITLKQLNRIDVADQQQNAEHPFSDGPVCLQTLAERGVGDGTRNSVMFNVAVYAANKFDRDAEEVLPFLHDVNDKHFDPRIDDQEVQRIWKSVQDSEYRYTCTQAPIKDVCNRGVCMRRQWGVRLNGESFGFGTLWHHLPRMQDDDAPLWDDGTWRLQINHNDEQHILPLTIEDLLSYRAVYVAAARRRVILPEYDQNEWRDMINRKIVMAEDVHVPEEFTAIGALRMHISKFLNLYAAGTEDKVEVLHGKAWHNAEDGTYWFKSEHFLAYLKAQRFHDIAGNLLYDTLRQRFEFDTKLKKRIGGQKDQTRLWSCPDRLRIQKDGDVVQGFGRDDVF